MGVPSYCVSPSDCSRPYDLCGPCDLCAESNTGAACSWKEQCTSAYCRYGTCAETVSNGEACDEDDQCGDEDNVCSLQQSICVRCPSYCTIPNDCNNDLCESCDL